MFEKLILVLLIFPLEWGEDSLLITPLGLTQSVDDKRQNYHYKRTSKQY